MAAVFKSLDSELESEGLKLKFVAEDCSTLARISMQSLVRHTLAIAIGLELHVKLYSPGQA